LNLSRREILAAAAAAGVCLSSGLQSLLGAGDKPTFRIGACDWSLGKRQQLSAFAVAKQIGIDGVQVSFDDVGNDTDLRKASAREAYAAESKRQAIEICSLAMGILNNVPYATDPNAEKWVRECVDVMEKMGQKIVLLAFFGKGDINGNRELQDKVIQRLKAVAPQAEKAGAVLGVESWMSAEDHMRILDAVGSPAVKVYYDVANSTERGYDIYREIRKLGRDRICQVHAKENGALLGEGKVDFRKVREALDDIGWGGWLVIEGATIPGKSLVECYTQNQKYLRSLFPTA
jgi:sugar phosphate isomerase/epimerase